MRSDAANLLSRLGQNNFKYQEFRDNFADMELWPLFEALIRDPRISGETALAVEKQVDHPAAFVQPAASRVPVPAPLRPAGLFHRYDAAPVAAGKPDDVRSLLRQLGDRVASGEL
jgi:hypothetical protein